MPEMHFTIRWPDGRQESCYSPSLVMRDYLAAGESYAVADFLDRARSGLTLASERVRQKYGYPCSLALGQLARIEQGAVVFAEAAGAQVLCESLGD